VVLLRAPSGSWRDEALWSTDGTLGVEEIVSGSCRRWSVEGTFHDAKHYLGLADARVWCAASVERAQPMGFFRVSLAVLGYARYGRAFPEVRRQRPWYKAVGTTFTALWGKLRLAIGGNRLFERRGEQVPQHHPLENLLHCLAAVR
jgi:hypothetical protein